MAKYAYPASVLGLIISDVPGNDIDIVASGPISKDESSLGQAKEIANKFDLLNVKLSETPKDDKYFKKVSKVTLASGSTALEAMSKKAKEIGYNPVIYSDNLSGLASEIGPKMAGSVKKGQALLACGETTVIVKKPGKGGRNQDLALSALPFLKPQSAMVSAASDGKDNIDIAGAITDTESLKLKNNNATEAVEDNQSFKTLKSINGVFNINKITANVSDFIVVLREG
jgi:glycerate-2-kinase